MRLSSAEEICHKLKMSVRITPITVFAVVISVAGLSSSLAVCVSMCIEPVSAAVAAHCHDEPTEPTIGANFGDCGHSPRVTANPDMSREERTAFVFVQTTTVNSRVLPDVERTAHPGAFALSTRRTVAPTFLRI